MTKATVTRRLVARAAGIGSLAVVALVAGGCSHVTQLYLHGGSQTVFYEGVPGEFEERLVTCGAVVRTLDPTTPRARASIVLHEADRFDTEGVELRVWVSEYLGGTLMIVDEVVTRAAPTDDRAAIRSAMEWFRLCQGSWQLDGAPGRSLHASFRPGRDRNGPSTSSVAVVAAP